LSLAMGDDVSQYLNWLRFHVCRQGIVNSYFFVELVSRVHALLKSVPFKYLMTTNDVFNVLEQSLQREDNAEIWFFFIHSLECAFKENISMEDTYVQSKVQSWFPSLLPEHFENMQSYNQFPNLPTEIKLFIFCEIFRKIDESQPNIDLIGMDTLGNSFYAVAGRLYMQSEKHNKISSHQKSSIKRYLPERNWKLMADTDIKWQRIIRIMESFDEGEIAENIQQKYDEMLKENGEQSGNERVFHHLLIHLKQCQENLALSKPAKMLSFNVNKCPRDSICNNEDCEFNHYEQYHPTTTKYENSHLEYAQMRAEQVDLTINNP
ncbi:hypothetical protein PMAYCL1PPCAC_17239, partial [Pristionchus mayeri]